MTDPTPTYTQLLNRLKDILLAMRLEEMKIVDNDAMRICLISVRKDMINVPYTGIEAEIEAEAQRFMTADPEGYLPSWWTETATDDSDLPPELTHHELSLILRAWPWSMKDALGRWLGGACARAGITDRTQRHALQAELLALCGDD